MNIELKWRGSSVGPSFAPPAVSRTVQILAAGLTLAMQVVSASAQDAPVANLPVVRVTGETDTGYSAKSSTTATKTDTPLLDTPQSISVITAGQMRDQAVMSIAEAARYVPGVGFAQGEGNRETPIFRGISSTGDFFIDGIRDDVQYYRDLYNIERVEVFKGPNAMAFGRGATGGLINRVSKQPDWKPSRGGSLTVGSHNTKRATVDVNQPIDDRLSFRLNAMVEKSDSYRNGVNLERWGIAPTLAWRPTSKTLVSLGYEHFKDDRVADRGVSSYLGAPVSTDPSTFFGNPALSRTWSALDAITLVVDHEFDNGITVRNRTRASDQDKFYQNVFAGPVNAAGTDVAINAYNNATHRKSIYNQTDFTITLGNGPVRHTLLAGVELGQQDTDNFRNTGFFPGGVTSVTVPLTNPITLLPVTFSQSATDADNKGKARVGALYVQDQIDLGRQFKVIAGLRYDRFKVDFTNNRNSQNFNTSDNLISPRLGVIYKPFEALSLYANYSIAYQPRAGDQLSSLTLTNASLDPEKFKNFEVGAKWDVRSNLAATVAVYRLDRSNVIVLDPTDPTNTRTILSDGQRSEGVEIGVSGRVNRSWGVSGGYTYADAKFVADTSATLRSGAAVAQVPKHTFALWNRYDFTPAWGVGVGLIHRTGMFASNELIATAAAPVPNVVIPGYTRVDAAAFFTLSPTTRLQVNVENVFDKRYFANANSNTNITPGSPRAVRVALNARF